MGKVYCRAGYATDGNFDKCFLNRTSRLHRRSLRLPTRRKWAQSGYLGTTAQAGADADVSLP